MVWLRGKLWFLARALGTLGTAGRAQSCSCRKGILDWGHSLPGDGFGLSLPGESRGCRLMGIPPSLHR